MQITQQGFEPRFERRVGHRSRISCARQNQLDGMGSASQAIAYTQRAEAMRVELKEARQ